MTKPVQIKNITIGEGIPKVCVSLTETTRDALYAEAKNVVEAQADLIEWRADFYEDLFSPEKTAEALAGISDIIGQIPLIFTIRTEKEGGNCQISTKDYVNLNKLAAESQKADLIDVEIFRILEEAADLIEEIHKSGAKVIASTHDFEKTDDRDTLLARFKEMDKTKADILKMAVMPKEFDDVAAIMQVTSRMSREFTEKPLISMAMKNLGSMSRIAGESFGSAVTFAAVGKPSAPGQFAIKELRMMMDALHKENQA